MPISTSAGHKKVSIGSTSELSGFVIPFNQYMALGHKLSMIPFFDESGSPFIKRLFSGEPVKFSSLDAFMLIEELAIIIEDGLHIYTKDQAEQMMLIYNNLQYQTHRVFEATVSFA